MSSDRPHEPSPDRSDPLAVLGRLGRPVGLEGDMVLRPLSDDPRWYCDLDPDRVYLLREGAPARRIRTSFWMRRAGMLFAKMEGIDSPEAAREFTGCALAIAEGDRPALDEGDYYADELIGLDVLDCDGERLGHVADVADSANQTFLSVHGAMGDFLLSPQRALIESVDLSARQIRLRVKYQA